MKRTLFSFLPLGFLLLTLTAASPPSGNKAYKPNLLSKQTQECLECHKDLHPGILGDWRSSRHAKTSPATALKKPFLERRVSGETIPEELKPNAVGCYECHSLNQDKHKDNFEHFGYNINVIVSPNDCKICHTTEAEQYGGSKKAHALDNLQKNPVLHALVETVTGLKEVKDNTMSALPPSENTKNETCYACHGTRIAVTGTKTVTTELGDVEIPTLSNWPNQGVGRVNPDDSLGACTACHPRHSFSIEIARKPHTCGQCHVEPDVPAFEVYKESKHGNIYASMEREWNWDNVPWKIGKDFRAPTCSVCHNSLIATTEGKVIMPRTHDFGARLWVRLFGLIYSHPQPRIGETYLIKNKDGLPLPTTFTGEVASEFLIGSNEQQKRQTEMRAVCQSCHSSEWVGQHFNKLAATIEETDKMTLGATQLLLQVWNAGLANKANPFDEEIEQNWVKQWLFYANSVRYASAMGGPDYATFKNGWWALTHNVEAIKDWIGLRQDIKK